MAIMAGNGHGKSKVGWSKNPNSRKYRFLSHCIDNMNEEFTSRDIQNFITYTWASKGMVSKRGMRLRQMYFTTNSISRFCSIFHKVRKTEMIKDKCQVWRKIPYKYEEE